MARVSGQVELTTIKLRKSLRTASSRVALIDEGVSKH